MQLYQPVLQGSAIALWKPRLTTDVISVGTVYLVWEHSYCVLYVQLYLFPLKWKGAGGVGVQQVNLQQKHAVPKRPPSATPMSKFCSN